MTSQKTYESLIDFTKALGKHPVSCKVEYRYFGKGVVFLRTDSFGVEFICRRMRAGDTPMTGLSGGWEEQAGPLL